MTRDCYQIITDKPALEQFIDWLPDHSREETYFYALFYREKYNTGAKKSGGGNLLFRGISDKKSLFRKIQQLECPIGSYEKAGEPVPQECLALYINPNPRSLPKASLNTISALVDNLKTKNSQASPHKEALACIQTSPADKPFVTFDIDNKEPLYVVAALKTLYPVLPAIIETRGGYHLLVPRIQIPQIENKMWHKTLAEISDENGDILSPIIGASQGGFTPRFVDPKDFSWQRPNLPYIFRLKWIFSQR